MTQSQNHLEIAKKAVVRVGDGRGFVVAGIEERRYVITAARCLPRLPTPRVFREVEEGTLPQIIGTLGSEPMVWAQLCFVDPMSDVAVLCEPDALPDELERYEVFTGAVEPVPIGAPPETLPSHLWTAETETSAYVLSLNGRWQPVTVQYGGRFVVVQKGSGKIKGGRSGSPIINNSSEAIGIISTGEKNPSVMDCLPRWLLGKLGQP